MSDKPNYMLAEDYDAVTQNDYGLQDIFYFLIITVGRVRSASKTVKDEKLNGIDLRCTMQ